MLGASGDTCSDALCSVAISTIVGSFGSALGTACSLVALALAIAGFPPAASSSGTSVDAELSFDKCTVNVTYYYLLLLLMLSLSMPSYHLINAQLMLRITTCFYY
jgi:hypothetical protein